MWLILSSRNDRSAAWAFNALRCLGVTPLEWLQTESLLGALGQDSGSAKLKLPGGRVLRDGEVKGVLNRLAAGALEPAPSEVTASYQSWLYSLSCPVVNRPVLQERFAPDGEWVQMANQVGLPGEYGKRAGESQEPEVQDRISAIVLGGRIFGRELPRELWSGCIRLGELAQLDLMGVEFRKQGGSWRFERATPTPALEPGGEACMRHLADFFQARR